MASPHPRNFDNVAFERIRRKVDPPFNDLHDELEQAYYGAYDANGRFLPGLGWRNRQEVAIWGGAISNRIENLPLLIQRRLSVEGQTGLLGTAKAERLFDHLHGLLFHFHTVALREANDAEPPGQQYDTEKLDPVRDQRTGERNSELSAKRVQVLKDEGIDLRTLVVSRRG